MLSKSNIDTYFRERNKEKKDGEPNEAPVLADEAWLATYKGQQAAGTSAAPVTSKAAAPAKYASKPSAKGKANVTYTNKGQPTEEENATTRRRGQQRKLNLAELMLRRMCQTSSLYKLAEHPRLSPPNHLLRLLHSPAGREAGPLFLLMKTLGLVLFQPHLCSYLLTLHRCLLL